MLARMRRRTSGGERAAAHRLRSETGQGAVELVALLPLAVVLSLALFALIAGRSAADSAAAAAQAGAMALLQDEGDAAAAARAALPPPVRPQARVEVAGRRVTVAVRPRTPVPFLGGMLAARASAAAGP
jgi:hypothetical protein